MVEPKLPYAVVGILADDDNHHRLFSFPERRYILMKNIPLNAVLFAVILAVSVSADENTDRLRAARACLARKGEVYFSFPVGRADRIDGRPLLGELTRFVSFHRYDKGIMYAYANAREFDRFLTYGISYTVLPHPGEESGAALFRMAKSTATPGQGWNSYPTYPAYEAMMNGFGEEYPDKCRIKQIGTTVKGRKLLFAIISSEVNTPAKKPRFMYTSSMHGNETTMYVNLLRMIDYLLNNYSTDTYVKKLLDSIEIWICPLENPDGTYASGDNSVNGATRSNGNNVDLNRNYPCFAPAPEGGPHPDGNTVYEPETEAMMQQLDTFQFVMSGNFHGGTEVLNYPWDARVKVHVDDDWMRFVYRRYVDTVQAVKPSYMTSLDNGITNGYAWYPAYGSRQDYMTHSAFGREVTIEVSTPQLLPAADLPAYWDYNYKAMLQLMEQTLFGIRGTVTDSITNKPLRARVFVKDHDTDADSSFTMSGQVFGDYYRPIYHGTWTVEYSCTGYKPKTVADVRVTDNTATTVDVELCPLVIAASHRLAAKQSFRFGIAGARFPLISRNAPPARVALYAINGTCIRRFTAIGETLEWDGRDDAGTMVANGCYYVECSGNGPRSAAGFVYSRR